MNDEMDWRIVDRTLQMLAEERASLDAREARWLRAATRIEIWRELGFVSLLDYMERRLGYQPHAAKERLRVALALSELPELEKQLEQGALTFTGVRELSRVMTEDTQGEWLEAARDKTVHEVEGLVSGHAKGDLPSDAPRPELETRVLRYTVKPTTYALVRQVKQILGQLDDDQLLSAMCAAVLEGLSHKTERNGRAKYQVAVSLCKQCGNGTQRGGGIEVSMDAAAVERAQCDAQRVEDLHLNEPTRATQDVPPSI